jgi:predicted Fe-Mo cluster-binding NifX family protein
MRVAIATDQDFVAPGFGCCPACTIVDVVNGDIRETFIVPNAGAKHEYWAELFCRNGVKHLIVGKIGAHAQSVMHWWGIEVIAGIQGRIDDVVRRFDRGELRCDAAPGSGDCASPALTTCAGPPQTAQIRDHHNTCERIHLTEESPWKT